MAVSRRGRTAPILGIALLAMALVAVLVSGCAGDAQQLEDPSDQTAEEVVSDATSDEGGDAEEDAVDPNDPYATGVHHATIEVEGYGTIEVALNANVAPITVSNFCHLVEEGFYDGLTFHRVVDGFVIQGGDPNGNGTGGSGATIKGEFSENGVENSIPHVRGTISMARSTDYDSASSQFFIVQQTASDLDGKYAAFGNVTSGMEVVDAICEKVPTEDGSGTVDPENQPVITKITLVD